MLRLKQDHGWMEQDWRELEPQLRGVADGQVGLDLDKLREDTRVFTALSHDHMALEESLIYPQARARLSVGERRDIGRALAAQHRQRAPVDPPQAATLAT